MGNEMTRPIRSWEEQDVYTGWRRLYCWTQRAGATHKVKKRTWRRERRSERASLRRRGGEGDEAW